ncbi:uncharacterized protein LOC114284062 [Camellia sinensis]|uniref:uncharacterized protein LOC114284062 n=1 Tax=Camellia sinensis TaxID=4442 RepID=UPI00103682AB|nr:uncharacterized protein LOC114284062 [Camellia sinensis]
MSSSVELGGKSVQRGRAFLMEEDKNLCNAWLEISQDPMDQAKILFAQHPEKRKGFQYDHVWPILKGAEKWLDNTPKKNPQQGYDYFEGFQNGSPISVSLVTPSSIDLNTNEKTVAEVDHHVNSSSHPIKRKKEKLRMMQIANKSHLLESIVEGNQEIMVNLK